MVSCIILDGAACDRCGKEGLQLSPYKLSGGSITFRGKVIDFPWLCQKCTMAEKRKWWVKQG